jgi:hypothetical protein
MSSRGRSDIDRPLALAHNLGGCPGEMVLLVSAVARNSTEYSNDMSTRDATRLVRETQADRGDTDRLTLRRHCPRQGMAAGLAEVGRAAKFLK